MSNDDNVIDAEVVEIVDNRPAVKQDHAWSDEPVDTVTRSSGKTYTAKPGRTAEGLSLDAAAVARHEAALAGNPERRCVATNSKGERCRKFSIAGSTCCRTHGGATERVKSKARIRVENASNRLMGKLIEFAFDDTKPPDVQLRAIRDSLDRSGLKPPAEVILSQGEAKPSYEAVFDVIGGSAGDYPDESSSPSFSSAHSAPPNGATDHREEWDQARARDLGREQAEADYLANLQTRHGDSTYSTAGPASSHADPSSSARRRDSDRDSVHQAGGRHITGEAAMRAANMVNQMNQDQPPPMRQLESPHKRYPRR
jgi:hypothetical protein